MSLQQMEPNVRFQLIGEVTAVLMKSDLHLKYQVSDIVKNFLPALDQGFFRIYKKNDIPVALLTWAFLSDEAQKKYQEEQYDLQPNDWSGGENLWFIDFIADKDIIKEIQKDVKHNLFPDQMAKALRADENGEVYGIQEYYGVNYKKKTTK